MMKLIDNRYKVIRVIEESVYNTIYEVTDFWNDEKQLFMKLYDISRQGKVIEYLINNFINFTHIRHDNLLSSEQFSIIKTIDRKKVNIKRYYSTTEYTNSPTLVTVHDKLNLDEKLRIILQLCNLLDFLHYRGIVYKHLSPSNIFLLENDQIKAMDLTNIYENVINRSYSDLTRYFIAPEVLLEQEEIVSYNSDKYSLGMLILYLLSEDYYSINSDIRFMDGLQMDKEQRDYLVHTIRVLTKTDPMEREITLRDIINDVKDLFGIEYEFDLIKERNVLNFDIRIIGREKEINRILEIDKNLVTHTDFKRAVLINGDLGVGKTRFLNEISYQLRMRGRKVYYLEINQSVQHGLKAATNILRQTIKDAPVYILNKYGRELVKVLPELKYIVNNDVIYDMGEDRNRLRLFDRITNYLEELTKDKLTYIILDNIDDGSVEFLHLFNFILKNMEESNLVLIASYNEKRIPIGTLKERIFNDLLSDKLVESIKISNLSLTEIGEFIQSVLGMNYKPLMFSAVVLRESGGNPRHIEYILKDLYATGELFVNESGFWELKTQKYSDLYFTTNMDQILKNQITLIEEEYMDIMNIVSAYNDSIPKAILSMLIDEDKMPLSAKINELVRMGLLEERVSDWGYSYCINNVQLKRLIYYRMPIEERVKLHRRLAELLEEYYKDNYKPIMEELAHHLISSDQTEKALEHILEEARKEENIMSSQSQYLWEEAYEIAKHVDSKYTLEILESLGNIYYLRGENDKALKIYSKLIEKSKELNNYQYTVFGKLGVCEIYLNRNMIDEILAITKEIRTISEKNAFPLGLVKSGILYTKCMLNLGKLEETERSIEKLLNYAIKNGMDEVLGDIYNLRGLLEYFNGNMDEAIKFYNKSIEYFENTDQSINSTKPINNIANIYIQRGKYEKAMSYYQEGLKIVEKFSLLNLRLVFLNNIGELYCNIGNFNKAKKYLEEARTIAMEIKDNNLVFLTNVNLGLIYLATGDYEYSYNCYSILKESYVEDSNFSFELIGQYFNFLGEFYFTFGEWDKSLDYSKKAMELSKDYNNIEYLMSKTRVILAKYLKTRKYDKNAIELIRRELRNSKLIFQRRIALLQLGIITLLEKDYDYIMDIINEDAELRKTISSPILEYLRKILIYSASRHKYQNNHLEELDKMIKSHNFIHLNILVNIIIGSNLVKEEKYYQAINYLLESLDLIYGIVKKIHSKSLQISFIKNHGVDKIKFMLAEAIYNICNRRVEFVQIDQLKSEEPVDQYFDYNIIFNFIDDAQFDNIIKLNCLYENIKHIRTIEDLINSLTNDYKHNLYLILQYLSKETLAQRGFILIYDDEKNEFIPIIGIGEKDIEAWKANENLLALSGRYDNGILISSNLGNNIIGLHREFLLKDTRAIICVPIFVPLVELNMPSVERRKKDIGKYRRVEGYVYLETDRVFNRFDIERQNLVGALTKILFINIENYKLKILSNIDKLTGTYTRKYYENEFNKILMEANHNDESFAVLMLDLDGFKDINDTYGHRKGDEILSIIGETLINSVRSTDLVARYGGEEFIIILRNVLGDEAKNISEKIRRNVEEIKFHNVKGPVTLSIGISMFPFHSQFKEELIEKADQALYCAKERGKNRVIMWDTDLANSLNRGDRLAGILTGNANKDQKNILAILDVIQIANENINYTEKVFAFLGRVIEVLEAEKCALIEFDDSNKKIVNSYARSRLNLRWVEPDFINENIVEKILHKGEGEFLIDWESISEKNLNLNMPDWQSVIAIPLISNNQIKALVYITVPIKEKEFDYNNYNLAKALCDIFSTILET